MNTEEQKLIESFLNQANPKLAKSNQRFFKQGDDSYCKNDLLLGIPMSKLKEFIKETPSFQLSSIYELINSEYNEARVLGWALLVREHKDLEIIKTSTIKYAKTCGNWNVVDFSAPLISKLIYRKEDNQEVQSLAYELLFKDTNLWTKRFAIVMALPLVRQGNFNYAIDVVERCLLSEEDLIRKPCGWVLREIGKQNKNILTYFIKDNKNKMSSITKSYALEHFSKEEKIEILS